MSSKRKNEKSLIGRPKPEDVRIGDVYAHFQFGDFLPVLLVENDVAYTIGDEDGAAQIDVSALLDDAEGYEYIGTVDPVALEILQKTYDLEPCDDEEDDVDEDDGDIGEEANEDEEDE